MPELPEVETLRRDLEEEVVGRDIAAVAVTGARSVRRHVAGGGAFAAQLVGQRLERVGRRGKYLLFGLGGGHVLVAHLGMSGQLLWTSRATDPLAPHTHVRLAFSGGGELRFVDPRTFGQLFVTAPGPGGGVPELAHLGPDPLAVGPAALGRALGARRARLKPLIMDQRFLAGIGNIYADEILFAARLRGDRVSDSLVAAEVRRLQRSMVATLTTAIGARGSSLSDEQYRDLYGLPGGFQGRHRVYGREGRPCSRCRTPIVRERAGGRSSYFCPRCQS